MNLYRNFGNLMEAWVAEQSPDPQLLEDIPEASPTHSSFSSSGWEKNVRTESVDSGVETASTDTFFATSSLSTDMAEMDSFASGQGTEMAFSSMGSASLPRYWSPPASSQPTSPRRVQGSAVFNQKLKQALQRSESRRQSEAHASDQHFQTASRRRPSILRSESFGSCMTPNPSAPSFLVSGMDKQMLPSRSTMELMQDHNEVASTGLSPGFKYLEQVCQRLEDFAKEQGANGGYHLDRAQSQIDEECNSCQSLEQPLSFHGARHEYYSKKKPLKESPFGHFRQRSASDSSSSIHLRKLNLGFKGQQMSTFNLLDKQVNDANIQEDIALKGRKNRKIKFVSLKRGDASLPDRNSQMTQSSERNPTRRQLSQLFRNRWKTLPASTIQ
ncbi:uncharacterized protein si:dkey-106l3.7 [Syngnathoides biaculeatus]|uniref:uncharacterized protein si:dkey-106l3.7 n=1 Tax=Syngnathoides biaculeatus TaxID=300417 RepID=UPI002ADE2216|nr:uncharacterized protein si:dkey-106l3.7 [Syngnathoides biaculeatus]